MPGDRALSMLIDIRARDSASSIVRMLGGLFSGFAASLGKIGMAFKLFDMGAPITGMKALAEGIKGVMAASLELLGLITLVGAAIALAHHARGGCYRSCPGCSGRACRRQFPAGLKSAGHRGR